MSKKIVLYDGLKAVPAWDVDSLEGWTITGGQEDAQGIDLFFQRVPWLYRGVVDRANAVGKMPFSIMRGDAEIDNGTDYRNALKFLPSPTMLFRQVEQSLVMVGRAYLFLETNRGGFVQSVKYCNPYSIEEIYDKQTGYLVGYKRRYGAQGLTKEVPVENIVAIYSVEYLTETGKPQSSAAMAALTASGVLYNADRFIADYFRRGAIKATVLTVDGGREEAERLQSWWADVVTGIKNAWSALVLRMKDIKATVIGEGLEALQDKELTTARRQDIATALGIPESHLWSAAANYATRVEDEKAYYENTIIPECDTIAEAINNQLFTPVHKLEGYRLVFNSGGLDIFQADNNEQMQAANGFIDFLTKCPTADLAMATCAILNIEITADLQAAIEAYYAEKKALAEEMAANMAQAAQPPETGQTSQNDDDNEDDDEPPAANEQEVRSVLAAWRRKAELALKKTGSALCPFETTIIPADQQAAIRLELAKATTKDEIRAAMDAQPDYLSELRRANDLLERMIAA